MKTGDVVVIGAFDQVGEHLFQVGARKVRFMGRQLPAYRLIFCILNRVAAGYDDVFRHRCNNWRCVSNHSTVRAGLCGCRGSIVKRIGTHGFAARRATR